MSRNRTLRGEDSSVAGFDATSKEEISNMCLNFRHLFLSTRCFKFVSNGGLSLSE